MELNTGQRAPRLWLGLLLVVVVTAGLAFGGRYLYRLRPDVTVNQPTVADEPRASGAPSASRKPGQDETTVAGTEDAVKHPQWGQVHDMVQDYFNAINGRDYKTFSNTLSRQRQEAMPQSKFTHDFRTTQDSGIQIFRIEAAPDGKLRLMLGFTSHQDPADAPQELPVDCIEWHVVWPLVKENNHWRIDSGPETLLPQHQACASQ